MYNFTLQVDVNQPVLSREEFYAKYLHPKHVKKGLRAAIYKAYVFARYHEGYLTLIYRNFGDIHSCEVSFAYLQSYIPTYGFTNGFHLSHIDIPLRVADIPKLKALQELVQ